MTESYVKLGDAYSITWRSYVLRVIIGHFLVLIGWPVISFLTTGDWLSRWQLGVATAVGPALLALGWGYLRRTKPPPLDPDLQGKLELFRELEREALRKREDLS